MQCQKLILRPEELAQELGISKTTLWRLSRDKKIPQPVQISDRAIGWRRADIEKWLNEK
jgi:prophage regulatory protein